MQKSRSALQAERALIGCVGERRRLNSSHFCFVTVITRVFREHDAVSRGPKDWEGAELASRYLYEDHCESCSWN